MCTVTVVPLVRSAGAADPHLRVACNRDEQRSRPTALLPRIKRFGQCRAVLPIDPLSRGTWIAGNDAGLIFTLLNVNLAVAGDKSQQPRRRLRSRGEIIPKLLHCESLPAAVAQALRLRMMDYASFRLIIISQSTLAEVRSADGELVSVRERAVVAPVLFTSSGLGDQLVEEPRRQLFAALFKEGADQRRQQDAFHRHRWPDRPQLSVCMTRPDARTVNHTVIEISTDAIVLTYYPDAPYQLIQPTSIRLSITEKVNSCTGLY